MKKYFQKIKELWANKKYRSLIILGGYIIFFVLLFNLIDFKNIDQNDEKQTPSIAGTSLEEMNNYDFSFMITYLGIIDEPINQFNIDGTRYQLQQHFSVKETDQTFYKEKDDYYLVTDQINLFKDPMMIDFSKLEPQMLAKYLKKSTFDSKTEFSNGIEKSTYIMTIKNFAELYGNEDNEIPGNIVIYTYKLKNQFQKVELDLTSYNKLKISILYKNIGQAKSFTKESLIKTT